MIKNTLLKLFKPKSKRTIANSTQEQFNEDLAKMSDRHLLITFETSANNILDGEQTMENYTIMNQTYRELRERHLVDEHSKSLKMELYKNN